MPLMGRKPTYEQWLSRYGINETPDYDTRAAFHAGLTPSENGHLDDRYKRLNHITVSEDSLAAQKAAVPVGRWVGDDDAGWSFYAAPVNVQNAGGEDRLVDYFRRVEPEVQLVLPQSADPNAMQRVTIPSNVPNLRRLF